ncbi:MAG: HEAT repeat domain-containing protein, partial [Nitrososphaerota archaeon]|nr:HEAT repeat domain-containing protein [Nitrososphaerota archaeon]
DRSFKIEHTKIEIDLDFENSSISGQVTHRISPIAKQLRSVELDSVDLLIKSAKVDGKAVSFSIGASSVRVDLGFELTPGSNAEVNLNYVGTPKKGLYFRGPTKNFPARVLHAFTQGESAENRYWFPCYDYPNMKGTSEVLVHAPSNMTAISNGRLVSVTDSQKGKKLWHFSQEIPHSSYLQSLVVGEYEKISEVYDGISVEYYVPSERKQDAARSFGKTPKMLDFFSKVTGQKYPYPKYAQSVVSEFMFGGMENISATTLTDLTLHDERGHMDYQSDDLVSHELAHQWFGDLLTCSDWSHAWLNEGFATYFNALFREHDNGWDDFQYAMQINYEFLIEEVEERYHRQIVEKRYWDPDEIFDYHTYQKGSWVLNGIRGILGDELFWKSIRHYVSTHKASNVETSDFRKSLEQVSGLNFEKFFEQWLYSPGFPEYTASYSFEEDQKMARLEVEQSNAEIDGVPLFENPIDVVFSFVNGTRKNFQVRMSQKKTTFYFALDEKPFNVSFDPKNWILKKLVFKKPKEMFLHQLKNDENAEERIRACTGLSLFKTEDVVQALAAALDGDKFWGVRLEAGKNLGKVGTKQALDALLARLSHPDNRARRGIAFGLRYLADIEDSEKAVEALVSYMNNDVSYYVRAYAAWSLGFHRKSEAAFQGLVSAIGQDSVNDQVRYRAFLGFLERKDPRGAEHAKKHLLEGKIFRGRMAAAYALGKCGKGIPDTLPTLLSMEKDPDVYVKEGAAVGIEYLGDPSAIEALEGWLSRESEGRVRRMLREAIYKLRQSSTQSEQVTKLEQELQKVKDESRQLADRIASLEKTTKGD